MKILIEILEEHQKNKEDLKKLPKVGDVIEITDRDTSHKRGANKGSKKKFKVEKNLTDSRLVITKHIECNYTECFSYSDLLFDKSISWKNS
jgi:hypothetical protein